MKDDLARAFLEEAFQLEMRVGDLYTLFAGCFPEDYDFWHQLANEEQEHAALIRTIKDNPNWSDKFVSALGPGLLSEIQKINHWLSSLYVEFSEKKGDRKTALVTARKIEKSAGEIDYQNFMLQETDSWILKGLQYLNKYDRDHLIRIEAYMREK
jgi:hypothetical protein